MKFKLFDMNRDGLGVEKGEDTTPNVAFFFKSIWRKCPKLISINLFYEDFEKASNSMTISFPHKL